MSYQLPTTSKGFTIVELLVSVSIFGVLAVLIGLLFVDVFAGSKQELLAVDNVEQARLVSSQFLNEVRNANTGISGEYALGSATDNQIIFYSNTKGTSTVNRIRYYLTGTTLYKGITVPSGNPSAYNLATEKVKAVQADISNGGQPVFTYYDGNYSGSETAMSQPVNVTSVKFIKINLTVLTQVKAQSQSTFSVVQGSTIRNLKTNLGN